MNRALNSNDIYIHNDFFDMVANSPDNYDLNMIFDISIISLGHRKKLLDYIFKELILTSWDSILLFKNELIDCGLYEDYKNSIINGNDNFLKTSLIIYLEQDLKEKVFNDNKDMVNKIMNSEEDDLLKLSNLLNISQFKCDDETFKYVKNSFKKVLFEYNSNCSDDENNKLLNKYFDIMDNNQINIGNEKVLNKKN